MEIKPLLNTKENLSNVLFNASIVEILVEVVKSFCDGCNGLLLCAIFSLLSSITICFLSGELSIKNIIITLYNGIIIFLISTGCYESVIKNLK